MLVPSAGNWAGSQDSLASTIRLSSEDLELHGICQAYAPEFGEGLCLVREKYAKKLL